MGLHLEYTISPNFFTKKDKPPLIKIPKQFLVQKNKSWLMVKSTSDNLFVSLFCCQKGKHCKFTGTMSHIQLKVIENWKRMDLWCNLT